MSIVSDLRRATNEQRGKESAQGASVVPIPRSSDTLSSSRNTQEQLRMDHIQTLEVLENVTRDNKLLKDSVRELQQRLTALQAAGGKDETQASSETLTEEFYLARIAAQDKEIKVGPVEFADLVPTNEFGLHRT
jgi:hypothetical protein